LSHREYCIAVFGLLKLEEYPHRLTCLKQLKPQASSVLRAEKPTVDVQKFICPLGQIRPPPICKVAVVWLLETGWGKGRTIVTTACGARTVWLTLSRVFPAGLVLDPEFWHGQELPRSGAGSCIVLEDWEAGKPPGSEAHPRNAVCGIASEGKETPKRYLL